MILGVSRGGSPNFHFNSGPFESGFVFPD